MHIEAVGFSATAPGSGGAAAAAFTGDSLTIRAAREGSVVRVLSWWADQQTAGFQQVTAPTFHDQTRGYRVEAAAGEVRPLLPLGFHLQPVRQETLSVTIAGSAVAGDVEQGCMLVQYDDLPGIAGRFLGYEEARSSILKLCTVEASLALTAGPGWTGSEAINAESNLLLPNRDYAVLGAIIRTECLAVGMRSPDWGSQRIAVPGEPSMQDLTGRWFATLSREFGMPLIPVLNSGNRDNILLDGAQDENGVDAEVSWILGLLP